MSWRGCEAGDSDACTLRAAVDGFELGAHGDRVTVSARAAQGGRRDA